jgi:proteasome lid subunit RPN8/RPN11
MVQHAQAELPNECCGLLAGNCDDRSLHVLSRHPLVNEAASAVAYRSEPRSMLQAVKDIDAAKLEIVAIYHSHPTSEPRPSRTDLEQNDSPDVVHFIISLRDTEPVVRAWWLTESDFAEAAWEIVN